MLKTSWKLIALLCSIYLIPSWAADWQQVEKQAKGQTVYFYAWGGHPQVNAYLHWAGEEIERQHGIQLVHVKVADISEAITLILSEKSAGRHQNGRVDLLWVNGENFAALKRANLLYGPFVEKLPNFSLVDRNLPVDVDFSTPVEGLEAPLGRWPAGYVV